MVEIAEQKAVVKFISCNFHNTRIGNCTFHKFLWRSKILNFSQTPPNEGHFSPNFDQFLKTGFIFENRVYFRNQRTKIVLFTNFFENQKILNLSQTPPNKGHFAPILTTLTVIFLKMRLIFEISALKLYIPPIFMEIKKFWIFLKLPPIRDTLAPIVTTLTKIFENGVNFWDQGTEIALFTNFYENPQFF